MESYISKRRTPEKVNKNNKEEQKIREDKASTKEFKEEEKEFYSEKKSIFQRFIDFIAGSEEKQEEKTMNEEEKAEEIKEEKELQEYSEKASKSTTKKLGFFDSIKNMFSVTEEEHGEETKKEEAPSISDDIKEVLKIQNKWILKLPEKTIKEFKNSEDYKIYKETLKKYNLIKVKQE